MANGNDDRLTGKASYIVIAGDDGNVGIPITAYVFASDPLLKPVMTSRHYNADRNLFSARKVPVSVSTSAEVAGRFRLNTTPAQVIARLYSDNGSFPVIFGLDAGNRIGHGNFLITGFRATSPIDGTVDFSCTLAGSGLFFPNN